MNSYSAGQSHTYTNGLPFRVCSVDVSQVARAVELVAPHCDIVERLIVIPPSAQIRGVWFKNVVAQIDRTGFGDAYRQYFSDDHHSALTYYPVADFLVRVACAGALVASPERVHEGMFAITKGHAQAFIETLLGRIMLKILSRDPVRISEQGLAARRQTFTYGHWELRRHSDRMIEMAYENEYWWIESVVAGAAQGTFEACGIEAALETKLTDRFNGSTFIRW
jgi:uncharacterized protein (TIGR02265 family)